MGTRNIKFSLSFEGNDADQHEIDFYDVAKALGGFERSLAITTHLVLNNEIITQAPSLSGARIIALPPEEGSWKLWAALICTGIYQLGTAPSDTVIGHLVTSAYDYVISESLGFHVDFDKSLGQLYEEYGAEHPELKPIRQSQLDSAIEKCENSILEIHRPLVYSKTADHAKITSVINGKEFPIETQFDEDTFDYLNFSTESDEAEEIIGYVTSYNMNTFKGRVYIPKLGRPIPFILTEFARTTENIALVTRSLGLNAVERSRVNSGLKFKAYRRVSRTGIVKLFTVVSVSELDDPLA